MRIGHINYLNCLPLTYTFSQKTQHDFAIVRDVPAKLNDAILRGELNVSPVSSIIYAQNFEKFFILPNVSIMADGDVQSIILVSKKPIENLHKEKILLTAQSATSHRLLKIIMNKSYHIQPEYEIRALSPHDVFSGTDACAALFIGDDALYLKHHQQEGFYYYDLGREWKKLTGLCMVYAVWVVRRDFAQNHHDDTAKIQQFITDGFKNGFAHIDDAITKLTADKPFTHEQLYEYMHVIKWKLDSEQIQALSLFYQYAYELHLIEKMPQINIFA
ncbi:menaquinone biosynthetic enzyme MqnA/MqnD family protein [Megamonas hypermegale]|uniref:menaquinone biosynthetic enzyme MqnA/MqnD family protein n=1 Tax=Megamonas hypermegale TaxID=158847 RepID=UPI0025A32E95|nr:menaquinone biosynthesis protein [Megamonas hypermegale]MDM8142371.1 menaquinone biosynthesis protein [Megamonas hypermegale]